MEETLKNGSLLPAKWVIIQEKEFEDFLLSLESSIRGLLDDSSIKFINEYSDIINHKKSMAIYITMKEVTLKKRRKENDQKENEISESESVDVEVIDDSKKNKNKIPKTSDLDDSQIKGFTTIDEPLTYPIFGFDQKTSITSQHIQVNPPYQSNPVY
ncbi:hypothetical protein C1645_818206 [Glomus cerebriforme]|uniref:Uncharacterized protein n=1 Tax=Glomus cerebriforme TaxID=658196 RepID=A0A397T7W8_9GLOM|nr:hypothetical protein C1645_818206 [Glomus cerebriforme]